VSWLANRLADRGRGLRAGQLVLTGTRVPCRWLYAAPAEAVMELDGLGRTTARFS
jgi:2-oxo-3-hexenedioate decarboxylase/2-keto-4-pentenoate hydratase